METNKKGFDISVEEDGSFIFINLDKGGRTGGYVSLKFDEDGLVVDVFNGEGEVVGSTWTTYSELDPSSFSHESPKL
jgi:hypothetical protein